MSKCCFLDRDGVVNAEVDYLYQPEKVEILPGVPEALRLLRKHGFLSVVVTNQSGVARGMYGIADILSVHRRINELLGDDSRIDDFFYCPHHPDLTGPCKCRKPLPGMLLAARDKYRINMGESMMVGDRISDIEAGRGAGCRESYLVRTGYGPITIAQKDVSGIRIADDLLCAVEDFLSAARRQK